MPSYNNDIVRVGEQSSIIFYISFKTLLTNLKAMIRLQRMTQRFETAFNPFVASVCGVLLRSCRETFVLCPFLFHSNSGYVWRLRSTKTIRRLIAGIHCNLPFMNTGSVFQMTAHLLRKQKLYVVVCKFAFNRLYWFAWSFNCLVSLCANSRPVEN